MSTQSARSRREILARVRDGQLDVQDAIRALRQVAEDGMSRADTVFVAPGWRETATPAAVRPDAADLVVSLQAAASGDDSGASTVVVTPSTDGTWAHLWPAARQVQ